LREIAQLVINCFQAFFLLIAHFWSLIRFLEVGPQGDFGNKTHQRW